MGVRDERTQDLFLLDMSPGLPTEEGQVRYTDLDIKALVNGVVVSLTSGSGITEAQHELLDTLAHSLDETSYTEIARIGGKVTNVTVWATIAKLLKIREEQISRTGGKVSQLVTIQYDGIGAEKMRVTETFARTGGKVTSIAAVRT